MCSSVAATIPPAPEMHCHVVIVVKSIKESGQNERAEEWVDCP
jgi:hypothetical protein